MWHAAAAVGSCAAWAVFAGNDGERVVDGAAAQCAGWLPSGYGFAVPVADGGAAAWGGPGVHCGSPPPASLGYPPWLVLCPRAAVAPLVAVACKGCQSDDPPRALTAGMGEGPILPISAWGPLTSGSRHTSPR